MGWGRWLLLGDLGQQLDLQNQNETIEYLQRLRKFDATRNRNRMIQVQELQKEVDELRLYLTATLKLLQSKGVATQAEIASIVGAIDDGEPSADDSRPPSPPARPPRS